MILTLDLATLLGFGAGLAALAGLLLLATWRAAGRPAWLAAWAGCCGLGALALLLQALRGWLPEPLLTFGAMPLQVLAWTLFWAGGRWLRGAKLAWGWLVLPPLLWVLACGILALQARTALRLPLAAGLFGGMVLLGGQEVLRLRGSPGLRRAALGLGLLALCLGLGSLGRAGLGLAGVLPEAGGLLVLPGTLLAVATGFAGLALAAIQAAERDAGRIAELAQREAAALQAGRAEVERLLTNLPAVLFLRDVAADGSSRLLYRGGDIAGVTGWPAGSLAAQANWRDLGGPDAPDFPAIYRTILETGEATLEWRLRRPDGTLQWMRSYGARLSRRPDGGGEVAGYMVSIDRARSVEAELETVLRVAPLAVYRGRVTPAGRFTRSFLSRGIERLTGRPWETVNPPGGLLGIMHPEDDPDAPAGWLELLREGVLVRDQRLQRADGSWIWTRSTLVVEGRDAAGHAEVAGFLVDVTAERAARAELDRTLAAAPLAVLRGRIDLDGRLHRSFLSRGIERLTGWSWEEVNAPRGLSRIIDPASRAALPGRLAQLLRDGTIRYDHRLLRSDGGWVDVHSTLVVLDRLADGSVEVVGFMADVTAERAAQAQAAAGGRLAALGEMGTGLAHELKQPLATISLAAENALRLLHRGEAAAALPRLERIVAQAQRAAGIIENLRRFARGSDPGAPPAAVPLGRAVDSALALVGGPLREAGIEVELALEDPVPAALGQLVSLEQVLVNLLVNAADALRDRPPGAPRRIRVAAAAEGAQVRLTLADTGGGIPAAILPRLFEPFVSTKDADQGTGLGLSICHGLVKAMGGAIEARNAAEGAVFTILLPRATAAVGAAA